MERTVYIIKPEALQHSELIHRAIEAAGLRIVAFKRTVLSEEAVDRLYPSADGDLRTLILRHFRVGPSEIGLVEGSNAIVRLCQIAGESLDAAECEPTTIRGRFGSKVPSLLGRATYYPNGFHRSRTPSEAAVDMAIFDSTPSIE